MNFGKVETCLKLRAMLELLRSRGAIGATTLELQQVSGSMATSTDVSAIRHQGYDITAKYEGRTAAGNKVYKYTLHESAPVVRELF